MTETQLPAPLAELEEKRQQALSAVEESRETLEQLGFERRSQALAAVAGDAEAMKRAESLDRKIGDESTRLRTAEAAAEEAERLIGEEKQRLEREEQERHERKVAELRKQRATHIEGADKALGRLTRAIRAAVVESDARLRDEGEPVPTPAQALEELRSRYTERLGAVLDEVLEESRPPKVREKIAALKRERLDAVGAQEDARRAAHQISGSSPQGESGRRWHEYYEREDRVRAIDRQLQLLTQSEHPERVLAQLDAATAAEATAEKPPGQNDPRAKSGLVGIPRNTPEQEAAYQEFLAGGEKEATA